MLSSPICKCSARSSISNFTTTGPICADGLGVPCQRHMRCSHGSRSRPAPSIVSCSLLRCPLTPFVRRTGGQGRRGPAARLGARSAQLQGRRHAAPGGLVAVEMVEHDHVEGRRRSFLIGGSSGPRLTNERLRGQNDLDQRVFARGGRMKPQCQRMLSLAISSSWSPSNWFWQSQRGMTQRRHFETKFLGGRDERIKPSQRASTAAPFLSPPQAPRRCWR